ncbi:hypothetical protein ACIP3B_36425, partial [Streptomyces anulatus]|uniref:hypothetical protein n=1 Tax=Streptomyces anulatus TaxID=1892 RepID=UPI0033FE2E69
MATSLVIDQGGAMNEIRPGGINDEMLQAMDTAKRHALQKDLRALAATIPDRRGRPVRQRRARVAGRSRVDAAMDREHRRPADQGPAVDFSAASPARDRLLSLGSMGPCQIVL